MRKPLMRMLLIGILLMSNALTGFYAYNVFQKNAYHRNRMIEYQYLNALINNSHASFSFFQERWNSQFHQQGQVYILSSEIILADPYFEKNEYKIGKSDFYGYEFQFDDSGNLLQCSLYKP